MRRLVFVLAWVAATFLTGVLAWSAVNLAGDQVTDQPVLPLSSAALEALPISPRATTPPASPEATVLAAASATTTTRQTVPESTTTSPPLPTAGTTPTTDMPATPATLPTAPATSTTAAESSTPSSSTTSTTTTAAVEPQVSVHQLIGGVVTIQSAPGLVSLLSATPGAGFSVEIDDPGPDRVKVEFESPTHESKFEARWATELVVSISEEVEDGDD